MSILEFSYVMYSPVQYRMGVGVGGVEGLVFLLPYYLISTWVRLCVLEMVFIQCAINDQPN